MLSFEVQSMQSGTIFPTVCIRLLQPFSVLNIKAASFFEMWAHFCSYHMASHIRTRYFSYALVSKSQLFWL